MQWNQVYKVFQTEIIKTTFLLYKLQVYKACVFSIIGNIILQPNNNMQWVRLLGFSMDGDRIRFYSSQKIFIACDCFLLQIVVIILFLEGTDMKTDSVYFKFVRYKLQVSHN